MDEPCRRRQTCIGNCLAVVPAMLLSLLLFGLVAPARAASTAWVNSDFSQIRLIGVNDGGQVLAGLHIRLEPGWKTYWRSPGDSGVPTLVDWAGSDNVSVAGLSWPTPERLVISGFQSFVYQNEVVLPLKMKVDDANKPVRLAANVDYAVCKEICVPLQTSLDLELDPVVKARGDKVHQRLIRKFQSQVPVLQAVGAAGQGNSGIAVTGASLVAVGGKRILRVTVASDRALQVPEMFIEATQSVSFSVPTVRYAENRRQADFSFRIAGEKPGNNLTGSTVIITAADGGRAFESRYRLK